MLRSSNILRISHIGEKSCLADFELIRLPLRTIGQIWPSYTVLYKWCHNLQTRLILVTFKAIVTSTLNPASIESKISSVRPKLTKLWRFELWIKWLALCVIQIGRSPPPVGDITVKNDVKSDVSPGSGHHSQRCPQGRDITSFRRKFLWCPHPSPTGGWETTNLNNTLCGPFYSKFKPP